MSDTKRKYVERNSILAVVLAVTVGGGCAVAQGNQALDGKQTSQVETSVAAGRVIVVSIPDRKLVLMEGGAVKRVYPVAVGKSTTPSPAGEFTIVRRVSNPT